MHHIKPTNIVTKFLNIGVGPDLSFKELQKTYLFNLFVLLAIPIVPVFLIFNIVTAKYGLVFLNTIQILLYYGCLFISITRKGLGFRTIIIWLSTLIFFIGGYYYHNGNEFLMFTNLFAALILFESTWLYFLYAAISLSAFGFIQIQDFHYESWKAAISARNTTNMIVALVIIAIILQFFKQLHYAYESKLEDVCSDLLFATKEKERILQIVAHDLRSPINGISGLSQMLLKDETDLKKRECLKLIHESSKQSIEFIGEVMQMESSVDIKIKWERVDLSQLVAKTIQIYQQSIDSKELQVSMNMEIIPESLLDAEKIERVLGNLLHNAIKFSNKGGKIVISSKLLTAGKIQISISDKGIGIPESYLEHLFTKVGATKRNGTAGEKSYGIGLVICKQIIEAHQGEIFVQSTVGMGATFNIVLPLKTSI